MRRLVVSALTLLLLASPVFAGQRPPVVEQMLASRQVLGTVYFSGDSASLNAAAKKALRRLLPVLEKVDLKDKLVRIEGFADDGRGEQKAAALSIHRAEKVNDYLRDRSTVCASFYIVGFGSKGPLGKGAIDGKKNRVEIALYDNLLYKVLKIAIKNSSK